MTDLENVAYQKLINLITDALLSNSVAEFYLDGDRILVSVAVGTEYVEYLIPLSINLKLEPVESGGGAHLK